ncbi:hypothetical protein [Chroococcidiopsis cubana]|nr:hypothetical protein [Chroococcidiopsis cubana]
MKNNLPLTRDNAVIGWTLGKYIVSRRWNYEHFPVCTVELSPSSMKMAHPVRKPLGLWGI